MHPRTAPTASVPVWRLLVGVLVPICGGILPTFLVGGLAVQLRADLDFGEDGLGLAIAASFVVAAASSAVIGRWVQQRSASSVLRWTALGSAVLQLGIAAGVRSFTLLLVALGCAGAMNAAGQVAANLLLARAVPHERHGLAFGVKQSGMPAATMLAGLAVPLAVAVGWRWAYVAGAAVAALGALLVPQIDDGPVAGTPAGALRSSHLSLGVLAAAVGLGAATAGAVIGFLVSAAVDAGIAPGTAGLLLTAGSLLGLTVRLVAGILADRRAGGHLRLVAAMLALGGIGELVLAVERPAAFVVAVPLAFGAGWAWPGLFNLAIVRANPDAAAAATGITQTGTYLGVVIGPLVVGQIVEHHGYRPAWLVVGGAALLASLATLAGRHLLRREATAP